MTTWTAPMVEDLKQLWGKHGSAEVADILSAKYDVLLTRNSVIGKVHRLGIATDRGADSPHSSVQPRKIVINKPKPMAKPPRWEKLKSMELAPPMQPVLAPEPETKKFVCSPCPIELTDDRLCRDHCRWPLWFDGMPSNMGRWPLCGNKTVDGASWCAEHGLLALVPPRIDLIKQLRRCM